ncbi:MAG TPA: hypothetical protein VHA75_20050 [Rugosimonospora sp.]|nr:hypothetical protein [Rugosimonospora sp.]
MATSVFTRDPWLVIADPEWSYDGLITGWSAVVTDAEQAMQDQVKLINRLLAQRLPGWTYWPDRGEFTGSPRDNAQSVVTELVDETTDHLLDKLGVLPQ